MNENIEKKQRKQLNKLTKKQLIQTIIDMFPDFEGDWI